MAKEKKDWQASLKLAQEALDKTDEEKTPKLYQARKELVDTLQYNENMRLRAEKAEAKAKAEKETPTKPAETETPKNYPLKEAVGIVRALKDVHDEDVERVEKFAASEGLSITEALKNDDLKAILRNREEQRRTAEATNTGGGKRGTSKTTGKELFKHFKSTGELPDSDEEIQKLAEAELQERMGSK